jgi:chemotaxis protein CheX
VATVNADPASSPTALQLPEVLDLKAAAPLLGDLLCARGRDVSLDASQVRRLGGQCLQVILAAIQTWRIDGVGLRIVNPSAEFLEFLELFGIEQEVFA